MKSKTFGLKAMLGMLGLLLIITLPAAAQSQSKEKQKEKKGKPTKTDVKTKASPSTQDAQKSNEPDDSNQRNAASGEGKDGQTDRLNKIIITLNAQTPQGSNVKGSIACPATVKITGSIAVKKIDQERTVSYRLISSNPSLIAPKGNLEPVYTLTFDQPGQKEIVSTEWTINASRGPVTQGKIELQVLKTGATGKVANLSNQPKTRSSDADQVIASRSVNVNCKVKPSVAPGKKSASKIKQ
jgi:hypothetical protein